MENQAQDINAVLAEIARKDEQIERLRSAYIELQQSSQQHNSTRESILKAISYIPIFTGSGEITVNSFFCSTEYLLSTTNNEELKKEAVRLIFYKIIQGQAKNTIINIPEPDNWELIKETLKLRYRPSVEPHQIYRMIANLKVNNVKQQP
ncbi:uncharacterized protein isoform X2 [Musca autumnalis]|uniref:uncharacterized protein isoform X2 n=1 Tax=Musca autumnalis TaxID=221902 RepID=UPI003CEFC9CA